MTDPLGCFLQLYSCAGHIKLFSVRLKAQSYSPDTELVHFLQPLVCYVVNVDDGDGISTMAFALQFFPEIPVDEILLLNASRLSSGASSGVYARPAAYGPSLGSNKYTWVSKESRGSRWDPNAEPCLGAVILISSCVRDIAMRRKLFAMKFPLLNGRDQLANNKNRGMLILLFGYPP